VKEERKGNEESIIKMEFDYRQLAEELVKQFPGVVQEITLQEFAGEYLSFVERNRAEKTFEGVKLVCKHLLKYFPPIRKINTITLKDAEGFLDSLKRSAPKGVYNYYRTLRAMWNKGIMWNYLRENPFAKVKLPRRQQQKPVYVTEEQLRRILKFIKQDVVREIVEIAFYSGCRLGELVNLTWESVNLKEGIITIGGTGFTTKTRKQRIIPMHPKVKEILMKRFTAVGEPTPKSSPFSKGRGLFGFVFCKGNGMCYTADYFSKRFKRACRNAGVDEAIHFHCLRHGAATRMIMKGAPLPSVQRILGHSSIQTTMIYTHPDLESLREAVCKL